jgi:hypothetical protein
MEEFMENIIQLLQNRDDFILEIQKRNKLTKKIISMLITSLISFCLYGFIIGFNNGIFQAISAAVKLPILYLVTLSICFPTFFIFDSIFGSKYSLQQSFTFLITSICIISIILVAFAPVVLFFLITGNNYQFFKLLNVVFFIISGFAGISFFIKAISFSPIKTKNTNSINSEPINSEIQTESPKRGILIFFWIILFCFVGTQLGWTLRPFFGDPNMEFEIFRESNGNFYSDIIHSLGALITGK